MKHSKRHSKRTSVPVIARCMRAAAITIGGLLVGTQLALADVVGPDPSYCLSPALGGKKANCTANDTRLAGVALDGNGDPIISPTECTEGEFFDLTATFEVATNATVRYDLGVGFSADGDPNGDGALTGSCSRSTVPIPPALAIDGDACGDVTSAISPVNLEVVDLVVKCVDSDDDGFVNLPYYVSWAQNDTTVCNNAAQAVPGTVSKCEINDTFNIPVHIKLPGGDLSKTASVVVTYSIVINNTGETILTLEDLIDDVYGDILDTADPVNTAIQSTTCVDDTDIPVPVPPATSSYSCNFKVLFDGTNPGSATAVTDTVYASGTDSEGNPWGGSGSDFEDDATVTVQVQ